MKFPALFFRVTALFALGFFPTGYFAQAATETWVGTTNTWSTPGNWSGVNMPPVSGDALVFGVAGTGGTNLNNDLTSGSFNVAGITFNAGASAFVITGGTFNLTGGVINNSTSLESINTAFVISSTQTFTTAAGGGSIALGGIVSGAGGLTKTGDGTLIIGAQNTINGQVIISGGTLQLGGNTLGTNGGFTGTNNAGIINNGAITVNRAAGNVTQSIGTSLSSVISGTGSFTLTAANQSNVIFQAINGNSNTYSGNTKLNGGTLTLNTPLGIQNSALDTTGTAGKLILGSGVTTPTFGGLIGSADLRTRVFNSGTNYDTMTALTLNPGTGASNAYSGAIVATSSGLTLTKTGTGTQLLSGANTYTGTTTITAGTLQISNGAAIPDASAVSMGGGTLSVISTSKEGSAATMTGGVTTGTSSVGLGALTLTANSTLDFDGATNGNLLAFATGSNLGAFKLTVTNWTNVNFDGATNSGLSTDDRLIFNQNMSSYLGSFDFGAGAGVGVSQIPLGGGFYELGFAPVPEPATWAAGTLLCVAAAFRFRHRIIPSLRGSGQTAPSPSIPS